MSDYTATAMAQHSEAPYKLGLALSGGGARGIAHAGALLALEEAGLKPDIIAGVSAGSIVAVLYSSGMSPKDILKLFVNAKFSDFTELALGKGGLFKIDKFRQYILRRLKGYQRLEDLPIPTYVGVTNFEDGVAEAFHTGEIGPIIQASCSIPVAFPPVSINGKLYVDGGVLRNLPAKVIRSQCQKLIGINVSPLEQKKVSNSIVEIAFRAYSLLAKSNQFEDMKQCDMVVQTKEIIHHKVFSLKDVENVFDAGYINTRKALLAKGWLQSPPFFG